MGRQDRLGECGQYRQGYRDLALPFLLRHDQPLAADMARSHHARVAPALAGPEHKVEREPRGGADRVPRFIGGDLFLRPCVEAIALHLERLNADHGVHVDASERILAFGPLNMLLMLLRRLALAGALARIARRFRLRAVPILLADGAHAIDVDNRRTYDVAEILLERRRAAAAPADGRLTVLAS